MLKIASWVIVFFVLSWTNTSAKICTKNLVHSYIIYKMDSLTQRLHPMHQVRESMIFICCEGYREVSRTHSKPKCLPICPQYCSNGICIAPDLCRCNFGYEKTEMGTCDLRTTTALPIPNTTVRDKTNFQIQQVSSTSKPRLFISDESDINSTRLSDTSLLSTKVTCPLGLHRTPDGGCISTTPMSTSTRAHSYTTTELPAKIACPAGYSRSMEGKCQPVCHHSCLQSRCLAPNHCECANGYIRELDVPRCRPLCNGKFDGCFNGTCIAYNQCQCNNGTVLHDNELFHCKAKLEQTSFDKTWLLLLLIIPAGIAFIAVFVIIQRTKKAKWNRLNAQSGAYPEVLFQGHVANIAFANHLEVENELYGTAEVSSSPIRNLKYKN